MDEKLREFAKTLKVLFVEDDKDTREQMCEVLKLLVGQVDCAKDGLEGLEKFQNENYYDIVLTDISMPNLNGIDMVKEIKKINNNIHAIVITAYSDINFMLEAIEINVDGYLIKPVDMNSLQRTLKIVIRNIKAQKMMENYNKTLQQELEKLTDELALKYVIDDITGLLNRHALMEELKFNNEKKSLILIDILDFGNLNLIYGYEKGDEILREFAKFLKEEIKDEKLYRLESDKFAVLTEKNKKEITRMVKRIVNECNNKRFFNIKGDKIYIDIAIAIAYKTDDLLKKARLALEEIKLHKRNKINFYNENSEIEKYKRKISIIKPKIVDAIKNDLVIPYFQPIIDNNTLEIYKFETLARIKTDDGLLFPNDFIEVAEHTNLISEITKIMIDKTFKAAQETGFSFSINLSEKDLQEAYLIPYLLKKIEEYDINTEKITFEILENISANGIECSIMKLKEIKSLGFKIALDDFGTQNSNFEKILLLNLDYIKIDGRFVKNIQTDEKSLKIVKIIKKLANNMKVKTIAEYVENEEIFNILKKIGINYSQGYYFSKPVEYINQFKKGGQNG